MAPPDDNPLRRAVPSGQPLSAGPVGSLAPKGGKPRPRAEVTGSAHVPALSGRGIGPAVNDATGWRWAPLVLALCFGLFLSITQRPAGAQEMPVADTPAVERASRGTAPPVGVRGGEHADFTRLVFRIGDGTPWALQERDAGAELMVGDGARAFDLSEAFVRIPRTRLRDLLPLPGGGLRLDLACACPLRAFEDLPGMLVVDILEPPSAPATPEPAPRARPPAPGSDTGSPDAVLPSPRAGAVGADTRETAATAGRVLAEALRRRNAEAAARTDPPDMDAALAPLRRALLESLEDAVTAGRLAPTTAMPVSPAAHASQPADPDAPRTPERAPSDAPPEMLAADVPTTANSAPALADRIGAQMRVGAEVAANPAAGAHCLPDEIFAMPRWGDARPFAAQLAERRGALLGEFDRPDAGAVTALARLYLHLGFGAETRALLRAFPVALPDADVMRALSHLVEGDRPPHPGRLLEQADCPGAGALWAVLAAVDPGALTGVDPVAVRRAFADLPAHLRRALGPWLVARSLDMGATETARVVAESARRAATDADAADVQALDLALARLRPADPAPSTPGSGQSVPRHAPEVLLLELDRARAQGLPADPELAALAGTLAVENRGTALEAELLAAQARTLADAARHDEAFAVIGQLERPGTTVPADAVAALRQDIFASLAAVAPDALFVAVIFAERPWNDPVIDATAWLAMAERLADLGFPRHARLLLAGDNAALRGAGAAVIRAQSYLSEGAHDAAAEALRGITAQDGVDAAALARLWERLAATGGERDAASPAEGSLTNRPHSLLRRPETGASGRDQAQPGPTDPRLVNPDADTVTPQARPGSAPSESGLPVAAGPRASESADETAPPEPFPAVPENEGAAAMAPDPTEGLLRRSRDTLAESMALRESIEALLKDRP